MDSDCYLLWHRKISSNAQARISSVYGVNLGDTESAVTSKVSGSWKTNLNQFLLLCIWRVLG